MSKYDNVIGIAHDNEGVVTSKEITEQNIPRRILTEMVQKDMLVKESRGMYFLPDAWDDEWMMIQYRYSKGIYSHETALYLHGYTDRTPASFVMTFPRGYHRRNDETVLIKEKHAVMNIYELGIADLESPAGNLVKAYDLEKCLCDIVRSNKDFDVEIVNAAMKKYAQDPNRNVNKLMKYAKILKVEAKIRNYMEVLL